MYQNLCAPFAIVASGWTCNHNTPDCSDEDCEPSLWLTLVADDGGPIAVQLLSPTTTYELEDALWCIFDQMAGATS